MAHSCVLLLISFSYRLICFSSTLSSGPRMDIRLKLLCICMFATIPATVGMVRILPHEIITRLFCDKPARRILLSIFFHEIYRSQIAFLLLRRQVYSNIRSSLEDTLVFIIWRQSPNWASKMVFRERQSFISRRYSLLLHQFYSFYAESSFKIFERW